MAGSALREEQSDTLERLRAGVERMQGRRLDAPVLPVHPVLADLLPGGGLRPGGAYSLAPSASLLLALLTEATRAGSWCAAVGMPELGVESAEGLGVDLSRLVLVPEPGARWLAVASAVADVMPVVAVRPTTRVPNGEVARLAARLRDRGTVLLVQGSWPQTEAVLEIDTPAWSGLGSGHGYLAERTVTVRSSSRRWPVPRKKRMLLPGADGTLQAVPAPAAVVAPVERESGPVERVPVPVIERPVDSLALAQGGSARGETPLLQAAG